MPSGLRTLSSRGNRSCPSLLGLHSNFISIAFLQMAKFPAGSLRQKYRQMHTLWNHVGHARDIAPTQISFGRDFVLIWENIKSGWHLTEMLEHPRISPYSTHLSTKFKANKNKVKDQIFAFISQSWLSEDHQIRLVIGALLQTHILFRLFRWNRSILWKASCMESVFMLCQISVNAMTPVLSQTLGKGHDIKGYEQRESLQPGKKRHIR